MHTNWALPKARTEKIVGSGRGTSVRATTRSGSHAVQFHVARLWVDVKRGSDPMNFTPKQCKRLKPPVSCNVDGRVHKIRLAH